MRRLTSFTGIMLLSLLASGWGNVFAASFCPHIASKNLAMMMKRDACHRASAEQSSHSESHRQAMSGMEMMPAAQQQGGGEVVPVGQFVGTCSHCMEKDSSPATATTSSRALSLQKRDAGASLEKSATPLASLTGFFSPQFVATQNAPPGAANRKHLLLGVFLI